MLPFQKEKLMCYFVEIIAPKSSFDHLLLHLVPVSFRPSQLPLTPSLDPKTIPLSPFDP